MPAKRIGRSPENSWGRGQALGVGYWALGSGHRKSCILCRLLSAVCLFLAVGSWPASGDLTVSDNAPQAGGHPTPNAQPPERPTSDTLPIYLVRRVIILNLPIPQKDAVPVQERIKAERARREQRRNRKRKRLFAPGAAVKPQRKLPLPPSAFTAKKIAKPQEPDAVPPDQRVAIAQALLADALTDRLQDRLKITTVPEAEVNSALNELKLSPQEAARPDGAQKLCTLLKAQAVLVPQITMAVVRDGVTRDGVIHAIIRIPGAQIATTPSQPDSLPRPGHPSKPGPLKQQSANNVSLRELPAELTIAGAGQVSRVLFGSQYTQSQTVAIRLAAQQAAALAVHTLLTGQSAPFMQMGKRLAIAPVPSPTAADKLLFTPEGRRLIPNLVRDLPSDFSALFIPSLLPLLPEAILTPNQVLAQLDLGQNALPRTVDLTERGLAVNTLGRSLWADGDTPNIKQAQALASRLGVDYLLMAHITDIELEEGPPPSLAPAITAAANAHRSSKAAPDPSKRPGDREREAKAEAVGVLVRISDGSILWRAHAEATMSATLPGNAAPTTWTTDGRIAADAVRFALVDLERQLARYRAAFEQ